MVPGVSEIASMGPSRECDGDLVTPATIAPHNSKLQWGRRVNATETMSPSLASSDMVCRFNGAVA